MLDDAEWRVQETADYICSRQFTVVTLQFPDEHLNHAARVSNAVQAACAIRGHAVQAYILADTTYNSLSVDEVAAAHVNAQCVVHYGRASLTKLSRLPAFFVFPEEQLNVAAAAACLAGSTLLAAGTSEGSNSPVLVFLDQPLLHQLEQLKAALVALLEQQQGAGAAELLMFPEVPKQHMEPEQRQQAGQAAAVAGMGMAAGCCGGGGGGGGCSSAPQQQQTQSQRQQQQTQQQQQQACCASNACCAAPAGSIAAAPEPSAAAEGSSQYSGRQEEPSSAGSGEGCYSLAGYQWQLPAGVEPQDCRLVWVGAPDAPALLHLQLTYSACQWAMLDPSLLPAGGLEGAPVGSPADVGSSSGAATADTAAIAAAAVASGALREGLPLDISRALRRRYFLVEKARDASIVGILVGTLGAAGYADAVQRLRRAAQRAGKKTYTLLVGKPSPAKLANFPEIEVFVLVADPQGQILDSKEYLAPIITPHEALLAFSPDSEGEWDERQYRLDFEGVLQQPELAAEGPVAGAGGAAGSKQQEPRFSLLKGGYTGGGSGEGSGSEGEDEEEAGGVDASGSADACTALALHAQQALQITPAPQGRSDLVEAKSAADYFLHKRTWQGVEAPLVGAAPKAVEVAAEGRSGRAAGYVDEPPRQS